MRLLSSYTLVLATLTATLTACGTDTTPGAATTADVTPTDAANGGDSAAGADSGSAVDSGAAVDSGTAQDTTSATADSSQGSDAGASAGPSWAEVHKKIIVDKGCSGGYCHGGSAGSLSLSGDAAKDHAALLAGSSKGKDAGTCASVQFVVPGKPAESLLWLKVDAHTTHGCGNKMPPSSQDDGLPQAESDLIKAWITAGAKP